MPISIAENRDCMDAMKEFPDKFFDLAVVDPPYGINIKGGFGRRKNDFLAYTYKKQVDWDSCIPDKKYFEELFRVSKNQIIWGGNYFTNYLIPTNSWIIWDKKYNTNELTFSAAELAWTSFHIPIKIFAEVNNRSWSKKIHPTQKPKALYDWIFLNFAKPGMKVIDTHLGSGSSRIAAYNANLDFWGYEIDKVYFDLQEERFAKVSEQTNLFIDTQENEPENYTLF